MASAAMVLAVHDEIVVEVDAATPKNVRRG
jgi:DNA polymerase I-like protein with 3'-5' exonuclease and polymerase domains